MSPHTKPASTPVRKLVSSLKPSPENRELYDPVDTGDPDFLRFAESVKKRLHQHLIITRDNYIVSGHRRHAALVYNRQRQVRCVVLSWRRADKSRDEYVAILRDHNQARHKSVAELVREEMVDIDPAQAHGRLRKLRDKSVNALEYNGVAAVEIEGSKHRSAISGEKAEHVKYVKQVVFEDRREYWPLSVRGIHYPLLNYDFVRGYWWPPATHEQHGTRVTLMYRNDANSYAATSDLLTRLRLNGVIPWEAIDDGTRPVQEFHPFKDVREFIRQESESLFTGYWRDLLQTQPNYVEILVEKNTVFHMALRVARNYQIPTSSGRGFNSIDPYHDLYERYLKSGKKRLILIVLSDFDPEGERIPHVAGQTLRDDFGVSGSDLTIVKAGVTRGQIREYNLPPMNFAKESSSNYDWFVERNRGADTVWELEALNPDRMIGDLERVVQSAIDLDLFNAEAAIEQQECPFLEATRTQLQEAIRDVLR